MDNQTPPTNPPSDPAPAGKNIAIIFGVLFGLSELLAQIPAVGSNSVFQLVYNGLKTLSGQ